LSPPARSGLTRLATALGAIAVAAVTAHSLLPALASLVGPPETGGVDLQDRAAEVALLWGGETPYPRRGGNSVYPPASYVMLWPLTWVGYGALKVVWAVTSVAALGVLGALTARVGGGPPERRALFALMPASIAGVGYGIQNGQLHIHVMAALVGAAALLLRRSPTLPGDALGGLLLLLALIKPTVAGPFALILLLRRDRLGVLVGVVLAYVALTGVAMVLSGEGVSLIPQWLFRAETGARFGAGGSYGNLHAWSPRLGLSRYDGLASVLMVCGLLWVLAGAPIAAARGARGWCAVGLAALVARIAVYHQDYDDTLLIGLQLGLLALAVGPVGPGAGAAGARRPWLAAAALAALVVVQLPGREHLLLGGGGSALEIVRLLVWGAAGALCLWGLGSAEGEGVSS
jgi:hypothetical protein